MTTRQKEYLKLIIDDYIATGIPVASLHFISKYKLRISPATIRAEMSTLENEGYLQKAHTSSGRIPTTKGYTFYANNLESYDDKVLINKLKDIFAKRRYSIDLALDEAAKVISNIAGLTLITSNSEGDELMKSISLTPINKTMATIVIVTSTGRVVSKLLEFSDHLKINDIRIAVRLFKERLVDTPLRDLSTKVDALAPILAKSVKNYETLIQTFVGKIFDFHERINNKVYGNSNLINTNEIKREDLAKLLDLMQNKSIWSSIESNLDENETLKIDIQKNNISIISKKINLKNSSSKEISIVGSNRLHYREAKLAIKLLEKFLTK